MFYGIPTVFLQ